ncbi:alpha-crystallin B chain-like isoform X2 [Anoplophora glabripennis]|uniref:alpha-crystallin B chain-like isoform X2 n=1 Tax=Anoplophora glabripennis TaxID=217634 RepID=UPI000C78B38D|nr:alpha-crystallin B chain-like isoform X2 [Anoplophora glabripennis]
MNACEQIQSHLVACLVSICTSLSCAKRQFEFERVRDWRLSSVIIHKTNDRKMSLIPWVEDFHRPSRYWNSGLGLWRNPEDYTQAVVPRNLLTSPLEYLNCKIKDSGLESILRGEKFHTNIDVQQFKPEELSVKVTGNNTVTIEGKHEVQQDEHGYISRHFVRKYVLPKNWDVSRVESKLTTDGVLSITAPKVEESKHIPIQLVKRLKFKF